MIDDIYKIVLICSFITLMVIASKSVSLYQQDVAMRYFSLFGEEMYEEDGKLEKQPAVFRGM